MVKIGIIGHFGGNNNFTDGQTVKTKEIYDYLISKNYIVNKYDTYKITKKPLNVIKNILSSLKNNEIIIIILSTRGYKIILPLLTFFNKYYKRKIYDFVVGGNRHKILSKNKYLLKCNKKIEKIYVETDNLVKEYNYLELKNVEKLINFKNIQIQKLKKFKEKKVLKVCTFSRICKEKGIEESIEAVKLANQQLKNNNIELVIYGIPDSAYIEKFEQIKKEFPSYITYGGLIDPSKSSKVLKDYDLLLFLTYWDGEGMPGTIIDASCASLPTIATDWNCNKELILENVNGKIVKIHDTKEVAKQLKYYYKNQAELYKMRKECLKFANKLTPEGAMQKFIENLQDIEEKSRGKNNG